MRRVCLRWWVCVSAAALIAVGPCAGVQADEASEQRGQEVQGTAAEMDAPLGIPADWPDPGSLRFERLRVPTAKPQRHELDNGLVVYLAEDRSLPLVDGVAYLRIGSHWDPEGKRGLASLSIDALRNGGTAALAPAALDQRLEELAADIEAATSGAYSSVSFAALTETRDEVLELFRDVLREPRFDADRLEVTRGSVLESIRRRDDNPVGLAVQEFGLRVASGHPVGQYPTLETVQAISRADVVAFHERFVKPNNLVLVLSGDFESTAMLARVQALFADWAPGAVQRPELPPFKEHPEPVVYHVQKARAQSVVLVGQPTLRTYSDDYAEVAIGNRVLGAGGFSSRIFSRIRSEMGLAYSTGSQVSSGFLYPGTFLAYAVTRGDRTTQVLDALLEEIRAIRRAPISRRELRTHREAILNSAIFRDTSQREIVRRAARAQELLGLEPEYFQRYLEDVQQVDPEAIQDALRKWIDPEEMIILVVGDASSFDAPLSRFGPVERVQLPESTDPAPQ